MIPEQNLLPQVIPLQPPWELQSGELTSQKLRIGKGLGRGGHFQIRLPPRALYGLLPRGGPPAMGTTSCWIRCRSVSGVNSELSNRISSLRTKMALNSSEGGKSFVKYNLHTHHGHPSPTRGHCDPLFKSLWDSKTYRVKVQQPFRVASLAPACFGITVHPYSWLMPSTNASWSASPHV